MAPVIRSITVKGKSGLPIRVLTANAIMGDEEEYTAAGMNYSLYNPSITPV